MTPTVLLLPGAFTTASCWAPTIDALRSGSPAVVDVLAVPTPLVGLAADAAYVAATAAAVDGPVLLVGHGYGGAVASVAATSAPNVVGLVFVAGFALDAGESCVDVVGRTGDSEFARALALSTLPLAGQATVLLTLRRDAFGAVFGADLPNDLAATAAACQQPIAAAALDERPATAGWRHRPSWYLVTTADRMLPAPAQRAMARRCGAVQVEVDASYAAPLSAPDAVAAVIRSALTGLS